MKKTLFVFLVILLIGFPLTGASITLSSPSSVSALASDMSTNNTRVFYAPSISADAGVHIFVPLEEQLKQSLQVPRTSWTANLNLALLSVQIGTVEVHTGPSITFVSDSKKTGGDGSKLDARVSKFYSLSYGAMAVLQFNRYFNLGLGAKIGVTSYFANKDIRWLSLGVEVRPEYTFKIGLMNAFQIVMPIRATYNADYLGISVSIGVRWLYSKIMKAPIWLLEQQLQQKKSTR